MRSSMLKLRSRIEGVHTPKLFNKLSLKLILLAGLCAFGPQSYAANEAGAGKGPVVDEKPAAPRWDYPQRWVLAEGELVLHAPQIREWSEFKAATLQIAFEYYPSADPTPKLGTLVFSGTSEVDMKQRMVQIRDIEIKELIFSRSTARVYQPAIEQALKRKTVAVPLDLFLTHLAPDAIASSTPPGFNTAPPAIHFTKTPSILLFVNGESVLTPLGAGDISVVVNANWPTFRHNEDKHFYLLNRDTWFSAAKITGPWAAAKTLPVAFQRIPKAELQPAIRAAIPLKPSHKPQPVVVVVSKPTELIVVDGAAKIVKVEHAEGLAYVANTESPLFVYQQQWYFLTAGRWFSSADPAAGVWVYVEELPSVFMLIPTDHPRATVRVSVPGASEANIAAMEAMLPIRNEVLITFQAPKVSYAGTPKFVAIKKTKVARAVNTSYDVLKYKGHYYLCYGGVWFRASAALGPWKVTADVPAAIYAIPPSSPSYQVTEVKVVGSTSTTVVYTYTQAYTSSIYIVAGVPVYGTGWYYPPYIYGPVYYPYYVSYGHGSWYNSSTGTYGSRSVAYGPYGGYSYTEGYNPNTGRYGYIETVWDNDEWASYGETNNPRTGVSTQTSRYYDADKNRMETERDISRGNHSLTTNRTTNFNNGTSSVQRETGRGGSSNTQRQLNDGTLTSQGTLTSAKGRTASYTGEQTWDGGTTTFTGSEGGTGTVNREHSDGSTTREGSFSNNGETVTSKTTRNGSNTHSTASSTGGAHGASVSDGPGSRTSVGKSASGDLYAGHDGNVYKKADGGWSKYDGDSWQAIDTPKRPQGGATSAGAWSQDRARFSSASGSALSGYSKGMATNRSSLDRDFSARQRGNQQFFQRRGQLSQGRSRFGGGGRRR